MVERTYKENNRNLLSLFIKIEENQEPDSRLTTPINQESSLLFGKGSSHHRNLSGCKESEVKLQKPTPEQFLLSLNQASRARVNSMEEPLISKKGADNENPLPFMSQPEQRQKFQSKAKRNPAKRIYINMDNTVGEEYKDEKSLPFILRFLGINLDEQNGTLRWLCFKNVNLPFCLMLAIVMIFFLLLSGIVMISS